MDVVNTAAATYELWMSDRQKNSVGSVIYHVMVGDNKSKDEAMRACAVQNPNILDRRMLYYRRRGEPTYGIWVDVGSSSDSSKDTPTDSIFEVVYNKDTADETLKKYAIAHEKHGTNARVRIIAIDESISRAGASTFFNIPYVQYCERADDNEQPDVGEDDNEQCDCANCIASDEESSDQINVIVDQIVQAGRRSEIVLRLIQCYFYALRAVNQWEQIEREFNMPRVLIETIVIRYLVVELCETLKNNVSEN